MHTYEKNCFKTKVSKSGKYLCQLILENHIYSTIMRKNDTNKPKNSQKVWSCCQIGIIRETIESREIRCAHMHMLKLSLFICRHFFMSSFLYKVLLETVQMPTTGQKGTYKSIKLHYFCRIITIR